MVTSMAALVVQGLRVQRGGVQVLNGIDLTVAAGQVVGLLGPSGCGKTTLLRALVGVQARVTGRVTVLGLPAGSATLRRRVAYLTQAPSVYGDLTVAQNLKYFADLLDAGPERVAEVIATVGLEQHRTARVDRLSGGQRARVSLATALLGSPELLVLDEPTVGLDPVLRAELWAVFHDLAAGGVTLLVSSHVMDEASRCDRLLLLREGRLLAEDTPAGLLARTATADIEQAFLALVRSLEQLPA